MSRVYDAIRQLEKDHGQVQSALFPTPSEVLSGGAGAPPEVELKGAREVEVKVRPAAHLVAFSEPKSLGAEKFRALVTRLENLRRQKEIKSLQVTSSVVNEGKSLVAANLALTFAKHTGSKVLLFEGDLHRPQLAGLFGLGEQKGLSNWWSEEAEDISNYLSRLKDMPLWLLSAGSAHEQPSHILQSVRFAEAFARLASWFDWIVVDSPPMLPVADVNLWSRIVDGTLLVVREGVASVKTLKKGLESLDNMKLIGTVLNEASESDHAGYAGQYYGTAQR